MAPSRRTKPPSRIVIAHVGPKVDDGALAVKVVVGERLPIAATVVVDGHDEIVVAVAWRPVGSRDEVVSSLVSSVPGLDRWSGDIAFPDAGLHEFRVLAWVDGWATWMHHARRKIDALGQPMGIDPDGVAPADAELASELATGAAVLDGLAASVRGEPRKVLRAAADALRSGNALVVNDISVWRATRLAFSVGAATASKRWPVLVEVEAAAFSTWYELFPRSCASEPGRHGTLADVTRQLGGIADLGFDVLYLPPIHPIGDAFRKGADNAERAEPGEPGCPWAIGNRHRPGDGADGGGHCSIHPELGTMTDFGRLVAEAQRNGMAIALDLALQCSPDHPWVHDHPDWFTHRPDGSIHYAENPPKKYQDVYPLNFGGEAWSDLWQACLGIVRFWLEQGVTIFRVDNPHTKPFPFWQWLIEDVRRTHPDTVFLSEAFTRPAVMERLTAIGFTLGYSYFPWRRSKGELIEHFEGLASSPTADHYRPSAWPNTPDILAEQLWGAPPELFALRYVLAATLCPSVGIYGPAYELCENTPASSGKEEYDRSEKYEIRQWDRSSPESIARSIAPLIGEVNRIRHEQAAFRSLRTLRFHHCANDQLLVFSKTAHVGPSVNPAAPALATVLVVVNLDPHRAQAGMVDLDLGALGVDPARPFVVHDLLADITYRWAGGSNFVELHPGRQPAHVFRVTQD